MALIGSLSSGVSAMKAFSQGIEVIGNNIANINTTGYKEARTNYSDNFSEVFSTASGVAGSAPATAQIGTGSKVADITSNFSQGSTSSTGVATDLAISGNGFFKVVDPVSGNTYATRAGNFTTDDNGFVLTPDGKRLQGLVGGNYGYQVSQVGGVLQYTQVSVTPAAIGDINVSYDQPTVANGGISVVATGANAVDMTTFSLADINDGAPTVQLSSYAFDTQGNLTCYLSNGDSFVKSQMLLLGFSNPNALVKNGNNLFTNFGAAGPTGGTTALSAANNTPGTNGLGKFETESVELSNVDLTEEFANMITTQRSFQAASRIITVSDDILQEVVNLKR